jgi:hypothetical protein
LLITRNAFFKVNYGTAFGDTGFTSYNQGGTANFSLGFNFGYQNSTFTSITVNSNGYVLLNGASFVSVYSGLFCTNNSGMIYTRQVTSASDLSTVSGWIQSAYSASYPSFAAQQAFVITWASVSNVAASSELNTFQLVLIMDYSNSFLVFNYIRTDSVGQSSCCYSNVNSSNYASIASSVNCTLGGTQVALVNTGCMFYLN